MIPVDILDGCHNDLFFSVLCRENITMKMKNLTENEIEMEIRKYYRRKQSNDGDIDEDVEAGGNCDNYDDVHDDGVNS